MSKFSEILGSTSYHVAVVIAAAAADDDDDTMTQWQSKSNCIWLPAVKLHCNTGLNFSALSWVVVGCPICIVH